MRLFASLWLASHPLLVGPAVNRHARIWLRQILIFHIFRFVNMDLSLRETLSTPINQPEELTIDGNYSKENVNCWPWYESNHQFYGHSMWRQTKKTETLAPDAPAGRCSCPNLWSGQVIPPWFNWRSGHIHLSTPTLGHQRSKIGEDGHLLEH